MTADYAKHIPNEVVEAVAELVAGPHWRQTTDPEMYRVRARNFLAAGLAAWPNVCAIRRRDGTIVDLILPLQQEKP